MTVKESLHDEARRLVRALPSIEATDPKYREVLVSIEALLGLAQFSVEAPDEEPVPVTRTPVLVNAGPAVPDPDERAPEQAAETAETTEVDANPVVYSFSSVRGALAQARAERGIDITAILQTMGYKGLSEVPPEEYGKLLEKAGVDTKALEVN